MVEVHNMATKRMVIRRVEALAQRLTQAIEAGRVQRWRVRRQALVAPAPARAMGRRIGGAGCPVRPLLQGDHRHEPAAIAPLAEGHGSGRTGLSRTSGPLWRQGLTPVVPVLSGRPERALGQWRRPGAIVGRNARAVAG
jgi:hypothetical protein